MSVDPRLADVTLLVLAAQRCQGRRHVPDWQHTEGLAALLDAGRQQTLPRRDPCAPLDLEEPSGLARLLEEARQWQHGEER